jgi:SET domain-containing protein
MLRTHVGLNYSFTLNSHHIIDSARVGNETRYINHGTEEDELANATAKSALRNTVFSVVFDICRSLAFF